MQTWTNKSAAQCSHRCSLGALLLAALFAAAFEASAAAEGVGTANVAPSGARFLVARPNEATEERGAKSRWLSALLESYVQARLSGCVETQTLPAESLVILLPSYKNLDVKVQESDYFKLAAAQGVDYVLFSSYELVEKGQSVQYYAELYRTQKKQFVGSVEKTFIVETLAMELDDALQRLFGNMGLKLSETSEAFYKRPLIGNNAKSLRDLGELMAVDIYRVEGDALKVARGYGGLVREDGAQVLANLMAGKAFARAAQHTEASGYFESYRAVATTSVALYRTLAHSYYTAQRFEKVVETSQQAQQASCQSVGLLVLELQAFQALKQPDQAYAAALKVLEADSMQAYGMQFVARWRNNEGRFEEALALAERLLRAVPNSGEGFLEKGRALMGSERGLDAVTSLTQATVLLPQNAEPSALLGDIFYGRKEFSRAAPHYEQALSTGWADSLELCLRAADAYERSGNKAAALKVLLNGSAKNSADRRLHARIGLLHFDLRDSSAALLHLEKVLQGSVDDPQIFMALAALYVKDKEYLKAIRMYEQAIPLVEDKSGCRLALSRLFLKKGEPLNALVYLEKVAESDVRYRGLNTLRGDARKAAGEPLVALELYQLERSYHGDDPYVQEQIARIYFEAEKMEEAKSEALRLIKIAPQKPEPYYWLSSIYLREKNTALAQEYLEQGQKRGAADEQLYYQLGRGYAELGKFDRAQQAFERCIAINNLREDAWIGLGDAQLARGKDSVAAETYMQVASLGTPAGLQFAVKAGKLFEKLGLAEKAKWAYNFYLGKGPASQDINVRLAHLEAGGGNNEAVVKLLSNTLVKDELQPSEQTLLAHSLMATDKPNEALPQLLKVIEAQPDNAAAIELAAQAAEKLGDFEQTIVLLKKYLNVVVSPDARSRQAFRIAELYERINDKGSALEWYQKNIAEYPGDIRNYQRRAELCLARRDWECARVTLEAGVVLVNAPGQMRRQLAQTYEELGQKDKALSAYSLYNAQAGGDSAALFALGKLLFTKKEYEKALSPLHQAQALMPKSFEVAFMLGQSYRQLSKAPQAIEAFVAARNLNSKDLRVIGALVELYRKVQDYQNLVVALREWAYLDEQNIDVAIDLGKALIKVHNTTEAVRILESASRKRMQDAQLHRTLMQVYASIGEERAWLDHLKAALSCDANKADLYYELGMFLIRKEKPTEAVDNLRKAVELEPGLTKARYEYGRLLRSLNNTRQAYDQLAECVKRDSYNADYLIAFSQAAFQIGNKDEAIRTIKLALQRNDKSVTALSLAGYYYNDARQGDSAKVYLKRALKLDDGCATCHEHLGDALLYEARYAEAAPHLERALALSAYSEAASMKLARAVLFSGYAEKAGELYRKIISMNPQNDEAFYWIVHIYLITGRKADAEGMFTTYAFKQKTAWLHLARGEIYELEEKVDAALISYSVASRLLSDEALTMAAAGRMNLVRKEFDKAVVNFGRALGYDPHNPDYLLQLGKAYEGLTDYNAAMQIYTEIIKKTPQFSEAFYLAARAMSKAGEHQKAIKLLRDGLARMPEDARINLALGHEYRLLNDNIQSIDAYEKAARWGGLEYVEAYRYIGTIYLEKLADKKKARRYFERYLKEGGSNDKVREQLKTLD
jgi:tetratricopeptide (TPR) repeat protein